MSKKQKKQQTGLSATECLEMFDDLPDGAALAAATEVYGGDYDDFITALAEETP